MKEKYKNIFTFNGCRMKKMEKKWKTLFANAGGDVRDLAARLQLQFTREVYNSVRMSGIDLF